MRLSVALPFVLALASIVLVVACKRAPAPSAEPETTPQVTLGGARPATIVHAPQKLDPTEPLSLVLLLHGYGSAAKNIDLYLNLASLVENERIVVIAPEGTKDSQGNAFWNATDACCDFDETNVDDVGYLLGLVKEAKERFLIDPRRVYAVGHSNGGGMALRLACDAAGTFAAISEIAGPFYQDMSKCKPSEPVAIQHMHGTADDVVLYTGGPLSPRVAPRAKASTPSAGDLAAAWAKWNECKGGANAQFSALDIDRFTPGAETKPVKYEHCKGFTDVELLTMVGSPHFPAGFQKGFVEQLWAFLKNHPKH